MLRAYSYTSNEHMSADVVEKSILAEEKKIIAEFVERNPAEVTQTRCLICGADTVEFAIIDGVRYQRCTDCSSVFAPVDSLIMEAYKTYPPLLAFRRSSRYQESVATRRVDIWDELLFWIEYRLARYLGTASGFNVIDIGNRYFELSRRIKDSSFCKTYNTANTADVVLFFDQLRCQSNPVDNLVRLREYLKEDGLLIITTSVCGFDVLALRGHSGNVFPYENIFLPSTEGLEILFDRAGYSILEISTPGALDVRHVTDRKDQIEDLFLSYLLNKSDDYTLAEFQRFLQKSALSSHAHIIARKRNN